MSAHTCPVTGSLAATRNLAKSLGASSFQRDIGSTQRDMMRQHNAHNEKWGQGTLRTPLTPPPSTRELI